MSLSTILNPKLLQGQGQGESVAQIFPGPANTTMDRSAIGENEAQDIFNVTMVNGVWELDQRYRQIAPTPVSASDTVFVSHTLPCYLLLFHTGMSIPKNCSGSTGTGNCPSGWGFWVNGFLACPASNPDGPGGPA